MRQCSRCGTAALLLKPRSFGATLTAGRICQPLAQVSSVAPRLTLAPSRSGAAAAGAGRKTRNTWGRSCCMHTHAEGVSTSLPCCAASKSSLPVPQRHGWRRSALRWHLWSTRGTLAACWTAAGMRRVCAGTWSARRRAPRHHLELPLPRAVAPGLSGGATARGTAGCRGAPTGGHCWPLHGAARSTWQPIQQPGRTASARTRPQRHQAPALPDSPPPWGGGVGAGSGSRWVAGGGADWGCAGGDAATAACLTDLAASQQRRRRAAGAARRAGRTSLVSWVSAGQSRCAHQHCQHVWGAGLIAEQLNWHLQSSLLPACCGLAHS